MTERLLEILGANIVIRGHEPCEGYHIDHDGKILTIFSRKGLPYQNIRGAYLQLNLSEVKKCASQLVNDIHTF